METDSSGSADADLNPMLPPQMEVQVSGTENVATESASHTRTVINQ